MHEANRPDDANDVAEQLARELNKRGDEYALGGAIALGFWAEARGTMDVDLTLFLPAEKPSEVVWVLGEIGCEFTASEAIASIREHSFCQAQYCGFHVDVFVPNIPSLTVFKMMFFRRKDIADVEQILRSQPSFDRRFVREELVSIYGLRDPRIAQWDELDREIQL